jgi:hypothetical protein
MAMTSEIKWNTNTPTDKSEKIYYSDVNRDLNASSECLVPLSDGRFDFGTYVHARKEWLDRGSYTIEDVTQWVYNNKIEVK